MADSLPPGQRRCYDAIWLHVIATGTQPTIRDLAARLNISSTNGVVCHLKALHAKGLVDLTAVESRGISPAGFRDAVKSLAVRCQKGVACAA